MLQQGTKPLVHLLPQLSVRQQGTEALVHLPAHLAAKLEVYRRSSKLRTKLSHQCYEVRLPATSPCLFEAATQAVAPVLQRAGLPVAQTSLPDTLRCARR